ncbi:uncharacterized [Tachysurus ichikawai]
MREQSQTKMGMKKRLENLCLRGPTFKSEAPGWKHGGACECMATVMLMKESQAVNGEPLVICTLINACYGRHAEATSRLSPSALTYGAAAPAACRDATRHTHAVRPVSRSNMSTTANSQARHSHVNECGSKSQS